MNSLKKLLLAALTVFSLGVVAQSLTVTASITDVSCYGAADGSIILNVSGGTPPYTYAWNYFGATAPGITSLYPWTYSVTVHDAANDSVVDAFTISEPPVMVVSETHTNGICFGGPTASIMITASGGTPPYSYHWNDGDTLNSHRTGLATGNYSVTVLDNNFCSVSVGGIVVSQSSPITISETHSDALCYGSPNASIQLSVSGGTPPYLFYWNDSTSSPQNFRHGVLSGTYSVTVTDGNSCSISLGGIVVSQPAQMYAAIQLSSDTICNGDSVQATAIVMGGTPPYSISWTYDFQDFFFGYTIYLFHAGISMIVADNYGCTYVFDTVIRSCISVGTEELDADKMKVELFPNPATSQLTINLGGLQAEQVSIYSVDGKLVSETKQPANNRIDIINLDSGVYIAEVKVGDAVQRVRWVKM